MKKSIFYSLLISVLALISCGDDDGDNNTPLTPETAQASLDKMATDMTSDVVNIIQTDGVEALDELFRLLDLNYPFSGRLAETDHKGRKAWLKKRAMLFKTIFVPSKTVGFNRASDDDDFNFEADKGIYNWDPELEEFVKSEEVSNIVEINFPSEGSTTNDVKLRITNYEEVLIREEDEGFIDEYYTLTELEGDLSVDGVQQLTVSLSIDYNDTGDPISANGSLFVNPYTFSLAFTDSQAQSSSLTASINEGATVLTSASLTVIFEGTEKDELASANGFVQYLNIKLQGTANITGANNAGDDFDANDFFDLELFDGENKIGDVVFVYEDDGFGFEEEIPYVEYSDGTREKLEDILEPIITELEDEFDDWG